MPFYCALGVTFAGLTLKLLALFYFSEPTQLTFPDEKNYYLPAAQAILTQGWQFFLTPRSLWTGPINPLWIALWELNIPLIKALNLTLLSLGGLMLWDITQRIYGSSAGLLALLIYTCHPPFSTFGPTLLTEPIFIFLLIAAWWLFTKCSSIKLYALAAGFVLGAAALTRPTVQIFPLFAIGTALVGYFLFKYTLRPWIYLLLGFCLLILPYLSKNALYLDKIGIANGFGAVLYLGNDLKKNGDEPIYSDMEFDTFEITKPYAHLDSEGDHRLIQAALNTIYTYPLDILQLTFRKTLRYLLSSGDYYFFPQKDLLSFWKYNDWKTFLLRCSELLLVTSVVIYGLFGLWALPSKYPAHKLFAGTLVAYFIALHTITFPIPRLALPIFPFLSCFAAGTIMQAIWRILNNKNNWHLALYTNGAIVISLIWIATSSIIWPTHVVSEKYQKHFDTIYTININTNCTLHQLQRTGRSRVRATGPDPYFICLTTPFKAEKNQVFFVPLKILSTSNKQRFKEATGQLFWAHTIPGKFREKRSKSFQILSDNNPHIYRISPTPIISWKGVVNQIRLDLPNQKIGVEYEVENLVLGK